MRARTILFVLMALALAVPAAAQTVVNPRYVEFDVSPDHAVIIAGVPVVTGYRLNFYLPGAQAPFQVSTDLGKPVPVGVRAVIDLQTVFTALPTGEYTVRVEAWGPGGIGVSDPTVPFGRIAAPVKPANAAVRQ